jgi:uncharacterized membrane protein
MHPNIMKHTKTWVYGPIRWIQCVRCEKLQRVFVAQTFALIAPVHPILHRVSCSNETIPNAPKHYATHQNMRLGSNGLIGCIHCEKSQCDIVAQTFALIEPVHTVLHWVSCSYETIPNAPKHYATHQNMSLGSNGVDWVRSLWKIPMWLRGTNLCINCTVHPVLHRVSCCYEMIPNAPKHYETHQNMNLGSNGMDRVRSLQKNYHMTSWHQLLH